ncbi:dihydrodipicolinate synthase family protein [Microbacterium paludicola]|uniref:Dihydrodipicolinate synthase family protein n=1 Tax=Microbacterium paludicola TaxID=300019 RepID=A0A4Y9FRW9_9MICO|nr:dihydrodipicolinate synthase family protein [Microbacterium paludicola]MBF0817280.1 dihydrodipicolinate synthase family protein [Microbacterium paludicola]TFU31987.1 dihydrodipicolinate synthase family protein [Microbacterium paludicola]
MEAQSILGGVIVATALPYKQDASAPAGLAVDYDRYAEHCDWLISNGCHGVGPNGSLGEYSSLTDQERRRVVQVAVEAVGDRGVVIAGVHAPGSHQARRWAELAAEDGAHGVLALPPTMYRASRNEIFAHYAQISEAGLPMMIYNNPIDTKVDLVPDLVAELAAIENVKAVKEFSGDVRRAFEIQELCDIDVIAGADDVTLELLLDGAVGWFAGFPNTFPRESVEIFDLASSGRYEEARELYKQLVAVFRWDSRTEFVQAIKLGMEMVGRYGGPCRPPRGPLTPEHEATVRRDMQRAIEYISSRQPVLA